MKHNVEIYTTVLPPVCMISEMKTKYIPWNYTYPVILYNPHHLRQLLVINPVLARTTIFLSVRKRKILK